MTTLDLNALQAAAEAAIPQGEWKFSPWHIEEGEPSVRCNNYGLVCTTASDSTAAFIAAFNPQTARALIDRLRKAEAVREGYALVPINAPDEVIVAIERQIDIQLVASVMNPAEMFRQDGEDVWDAAIAAIVAPTSADSEGESNG